MFLYAQGGAVLVWRKRALLIPAPAICRSLRDPRARLLDALSLPLKLGEKPKLLNPLKRLELNLLD